MEEKKNSNSNLIIITLLLVIVIILGFGFIYYTTDKKFTAINNDLNELKKESSQSNESTGNISTPTTNNTETEKTNNKCNGTLNATYYGEYKDNIAYIRERYTFKNDGTYSKEVIDGDGNKGTYTVKDGIITITGSGPYPNSDFTGELSISDDCNTITAKNDSYTIIYNKQ